MSKIANFVRRLTNFARPVHYVGPARERRAVLEPGGTAEICDGYVKICNGYVEVYSGDTKVISGSTDVAGRMLAVE